MGFLSTVVLLYINIRIHIYIKYVSFAVSFIRFLNNQHEIYSPAAHYAQFSHPKCESLQTDPRQRALPGLGEGKHSWPEH